MTDKVIALIYLSVLALSVALGYFFGAFSTSFNTNMCYSEVLSKVKTRVESASNQSDLEILRSLNQDLANAPLNGYESNCEEIKRAISL